MREDSASLALFRASVIGVRKVVRGSSAPVLTSTVGKMDSVNDARSMWCWPALFGLNGCWRIKHDFEPAPLLLGALIEEICAARF